MNKPGGPVFIHNIPFTKEQSRTIQVLILRGAFHGFPFHGFSFYGFPFHGFPFYGYGLPLNKLFLSLLAFSPRR
jgi:hypothetical protein